MKQRSRLAVIVIVTGSLVAIGALVGGNLLSQWRRAARESALDFLPNVAQRIQDFHRIKMQDGHKVWEIAAREAQYREEEHEVTVRQPLIRLFLKDGGAVGLSGQAGRVLLDGRELQQVELDGGIEVQFADYTVRTDRAVYRSATDLIDAPRPVEITGRDLALRGDEMEVDVAAQRLRVYRNVTMTIQPQAAAPGDQRPREPSRDVSADASQR